MWVALPFWCFLNIYVCSWLIVGAGIPRLVEWSTTATGLWVLWFYWALIGNGIGWSFSRSAWPLQIQCKDKLKIQIKTQQQQQRTIQFARKITKKRLAVKFFCFLDFNAFHNSKPFLLMFDSRFQQIRVRNWERRFTIELTGQQSVIVRLSDGQIEDLRGLDSPTTPAHLSRPIVLSFTVAFRIGPCQYFLATNRQTKPFNF